ncbi:MAG TPA: 1-deoxy-D-xylulose-5-phosphate reductoisomerase [Dehalococcoidales bacterium]|nr:1-deoxy-D-xylulose-5-phosphate reductoisomerase [Dehalococcoidales bacterium]
MKDKVSLAVLGCTGSIGRQTLDVVRNQPEKYQVIALAAGSNIALLESQIKEFKPKYIHYENKKRPAFPVRTKFVSLEEMACLPEADIVVLATPGMVGLKAAFQAVQAGKDIAIANKEPLVTAGGLLMKQAEKKGASILPVDSEHSAIWQCLAGEVSEPVKIILTASGGPFRTFSCEQLENVTARDALKHPSWSMGHKVTIDSATLMNKGLEIIEAHWLFDMPVANIEVIIHPQSIIHSMVEFADGSVKAQLASPDMRLPIQYALSYPERLPNDSLPRIAWDKLKELTFEQPDFGRFPCLKLAMAAGKTGGTMPTVLCAADEVAVELFIQGKIGFTDIPTIVETCMEKHQPVPAKSLEVILETDDWARKLAKKTARAIRD